MEGRDIGTEVFPDAEVKIFLDAAPEVRGSRRFQQSATSPTSAVPPDAITEQAILADLQERDARDRNRANSPLRPAADATVIDSTTLSLEEVLARSEEIVRNHLAL